MAERALTARRAFGVYLGSSLLSRALPFLLLPFLTRALGSEQFGQLDLFRSLSAIAFALISSGITSMIPQRFAAADQKEVAALIGGQVRFGLISWGLVTALGGLLWLVPALLPLPGPWLLLAGLLGLLTHLNTIALTLLRSQGLAWRYMAYELGQMVLTAGCIVWFVAGLGWGWEGASAAYLAGMLPVVLIGLRRLFAGGYLDWSGGITHLREIREMSFPLLPHSLGSQFITYANRFFLIAMVGEAELGRFAAANQVSLIILILVHSFNRGWTPWMFQRLHQDSVAARKRICEVSLLAIGSLIGLSALIGLTSPWFQPILVPTEFFISPWVFAGLCLSYALYGWFALFMPVVIQLKRPKIFAWITLSSLTVNLILNATLIPVYGLIGCVIASLAASTISAIGLTVVVQRYYPLPWTSLLPARRGAG